MKIFAERLKELRAEQNLTLRNVAQGIDVSINTVSRWERQERLPNIENIVALAKFFRVSADYLCGLED